MASVSFNGADRLITLSDVGDYDIQDIYSDWKRWVQSGAGALYPPAFDTTGGDEIGQGTFIGAYFFLRTDEGWSIKLPEASGAVRITGNLFPRIAGDILFTNPTGTGITVRVSISTSAQALVVEAKSNLTANAVWSHTNYSGTPNSTGRKISKGLTKGQALALLS